MNKWKKCKLEDICNYVNCRTTNVDNYISTENMLPNKGGISSSSIIPTGTVTEYKKEDILISNIRPYFQKIWHATKNGGCSNDVLCVRATEMADNKYLYYLLSQQSFFDYVMTGAKGCKMPRGDKKQIMQWEICLPPFEEQKRIAGILSALDDKIELNRCINENLEQQAQALFKHWFVDFEFPNAEGKPYKSAGGNLVDSELGVIPEKWNVGQLSDICEIVGGGTPSKSQKEYFTPKAIAWITPKDLSNTKYKFISKGETDISKLGYNNSSAKLMPRGSVLFSSRAPIGYVAIAQNSLCTNQGFKSAIPTIAGTAYLYYYLKEHTPEIESKASGSTFKEASGSLMKSLSTVIPPQKVLNDFEHLIQPIFDKQEQNENENKRLVELRDTLLPKLMNGEIYL